MVDQPIVEKKQENSASRYKANYKKIEGEYSMLESAHIKLRKEFDELFTTFKKYVDSVSQDKPNKGPKFFK